jgi:hypothetical protein
MSDKENPILGWLIAFFLAVWFGVTGAAAIHVIKSAPVSIHVDYCEGGER